MCNHASGLAPGTYIGPITGKVYPYARWHEILEGRHSVAGRDYMHLYDHVCALERPQGDELGYDVMAVDVSGR